MNRHINHRQNLTMAAMASSSEIVSLTARRKDEAEQRHAQIIEALREGKETHAEIARRLGVLPRTVSKIYCDKVRPPKPPEPELDPGVAAAEERLAEAERRGKQMRLLALSALHEAKAAQYLREAQALDK
jgi:transcriptional regulator with XRE-family HTH domain